MFDFIMQNFNDMLIALTGIVTGASALAAMTPTQKDDGFLGKIKKFLNLLALNVGHAKTV